MPTPLEMTGAVIKKGGAIQFVRRHNHLGRRPFPLSHLARRALPLSHFSYEKNDFNSTICVSIICAPPPPLLTPPSSLLTFSPQSLFPFQPLHSFRSISAFLQYDFSHSYYHLVLFQRKKIPASGETDRNLWREGKLLSRKSNVKKIRKSTPPLSTTSPIFPVFTGN